MQRIETLRWAYVVAASWGFLSGFLTFIQHDGTRAAVLISLLVAALVVHFLAFRRILKRPIYWSSMVAILTTVFLAVSTVGALVWEPLASLLHHLWFFAFWPVALMGELFGFVFDTRVFIALSWAWAAGMWWIVRMATRIEGLAVEVRELPAQAFPDPR